jgi:hypothetical protein
VGREATAGYLGVLFGFARTTGGGGLTLRLWKYVDLNSFLRLLLGGPSGLQLALLLLLAAGPLVYLVRAWWRLDRYGDDHRRLVWAATLVWTLVLNLYVGVYDTVLVVIAALGAADLLTRRGLLPPRFVGLLVLLFLVPWVTSPLARVSRVQTFTLVLAAFGAYLLALAREWSFPPAEKKEAPDLGPGAGEPA